MKNYFIVISGPSGSGKTTVISELLNTDLPRLKRLVTCTTRQIRNGEKNGIDYIFWGKERFKKAIENDELIEYEEIYNNYYGSPADLLKKMLSSGVNVISSLGIGGALKIRELKYQSIMIFLKTASIDELKTRLMARSSSQSDLDLRLRKAADELKYEKHFDFTATNDDLASCVNAIYEYLKKKLC
jgi:guanylate kinase